MGTGAKVVVYDIASHTLEHDICEALRGLHSFSGCDTTSSFSGKVPHCLEDPGRMD